MHLKLHLVFYEVSLKTLPKATQKIISQKNSRQNCKRIKDLIHTTRKKILIAPT